MTNFVATPRATRFVPQSFSGAVVAQSFRWRGAYNAQSTYAPNDAVFFSGSSYIATTATIGTAPPNAPWDLLAQQGQSFRVDLLQVTQGGQTAFTLTHACTSPTTAQLAVNGQSAAVGDDFTISGTTLTWLDADFQLGAGDLLVAEYQ